MQKHDKRTNLKKKKRIKVQKVNRETNQQAGAGGPIVHWQPQRGNSGTEHSTTRPGITPHQNNHRRHHRQLAISANGAASTSSQTQQDSRVVVLRDNNPREGAKPVRLFHRRTFNTPASGRQSASRENVRDNGDGGDEEDDDQPYKQWHSRDHSDGDDSEV
jgi:hypothetical protein